VIKIDSADWWSVVVIVSVQGVQNEGPHV